MPDLHEPRAATMENKANNYGDYEVVSKYVFFLSLTICSKRTYRRQNQLDSKSLLFFFFFPSQPSTG